MYSPTGDTSKMVSPILAYGKFVVISVPNGPDCKPVWGGNRQQLTGYYLKSAGVGVASLDAIDAANRATLVDDSQTFECGDANPLVVPAFMYMSQAIAEALTGAPLAGLARGATGHVIHGTLKWDDVPAPGRNVVAILPGSDPKLKGEYVAIGAHNDHIGFNHAPVDHDSLRAFNTVVPPRGEDDPERAATPEETEDPLDPRQPSQGHRRLDSIYNGR